MTYSANHANLLRRAAIFADKLLKSARPADLPVEQPTEIELVIHLNTAKTLGLPAHQRPAGCLEICHDVAAAPLAAASLGCHPLIGLATIRYGSHGPRGIEYQPGCGPPQLVL